MKKVLLLMFLILCLTTFGIGCSGSGGSATDGDTVDGDDVDGDAVDGDTVDGDDVDGDTEGVCPECYWVAGTYCIDEMQGDGCSLITVNKVVIKETDACKFDVTLQFSDDTEDLTVVVEGCDVSGYELFGGMCTFEIKSGDKEISVDCGGCFFTISEEACTTNCDCLTDDACCDGCAAINEDGACDDGNACTETDSCKSGVCEGADLITCTASDQCHDAGVCDVASGTCSNPALADDTACDDDDSCTETDTCQAGVCTGADPVVCTAADECHEAGVCDSTDGNCSDPLAPNGKECDALGDDTAGSGICQAGSCTSIGDCSMRTFNQPLGYACNFNADCESRFCLASLPVRGPAMTCSTACDMDDDQCPDGMFCFDFFEAKAASFDVFERFICLAEGDNLGPAAGTGELYQACNQDEDCESNDCSFSDGITVCSADCWDDNLPGPSDALCGDCGTCEAVLKDGEKRPQYRCVPHYKKDFGELCADNMDCLSGICFLNYCSQDCSASMKDSKDVPECPADYTCLYTDEAFGYVCVDDTAFDSVDDGNYCDYRFECADGSYCDVYDAYSTATYLLDDEYGYVAWDPFGPDTGVPPLLFSNWFYEVEKTGTYYLRVPAPWSGGRGSTDDIWQFHYQGLITTSDAAATDVMEVEPNNDFDSPQALTLPVNIIGSMTYPDGDDIYVLNLTEGDMLKVKFTPLTSPSVCTPEVAFGEACTRHKECAGDYCYNGACNAICDSARYDACPTDYTCVYQADYGYNLCIPDTNLDKGFGVACENDFECTSDLCYDGACNIACDIFVKADPVLCPDNFTCVDSAVDSYDYSNKGLSFPVCLPDSDVGFAFYDACEFNHQCESLICVDGACNFMCSPLKMPPPCPDDYTCINYSLDSKMSYYFCKPDDEVGRGFNEDCELNYQCDSEVCFEGKCTETCTISKGDGDSCVSGYTCVNVPDIGLVCADDDDLDRSFGDACDYNDQCGELGAKCWEGACNLWCDYFAKASISCPTDFKCAYLTSSGYKGEKAPETVCVSDTEPSLDFYDSCDYDYQCPDDLCYSGKCNMYCSIPLSKVVNYCPSGYYCSTKGPSQICHPDK